MATRVKSSCDKKKKAVFQKYYADLLRLLKVSSEVLPATLYSKGLISSDYMELSKPAIMQSLLQMIILEPSRVFEIIECFEEEFQTNSNLKNMRGNLKQ